MLNRISSILTGIAVGIGLIFIMEFISHAIYPLPAGLNPEKMEDMRQIMKQMPLGALIMVMVGYFIGALGGGIVCTLMSKEFKFKNVMFVGLILTVFGILNFMTVPHPMWFMVGSLAVYFAGAFLGYKITMMIKK